MKINPNYYPVLFFGTLALGIVLGATLNFPFQGNLSASENHRNKLNKLIDFIDKQKKRGSSDINVYMVVLYKKFSVPISAFILTIIAVSVSAMKRRGGMGMNLAIGIAVAFSFVFFDKIFGVLAEKSTIPPLVAVWTPNVVFGILSIYLLRNAKR